MLEDEIVQQAMKTILEPILENHFPQERMGYRPGRSPRKADDSRGRFEPVLGHQDLLDLLRPPGRTKAFRRGVNYQTLDSWSGLPLLIG